MHIAIEQQNMAQVSCAISADRLLIGENYAQGFPQSQILSNCYFDFGVLASSQAKRSFSTLAAMVSLRSSWKPPS